MEISLLKRILFGVLLLSVLIVAYVVVDGRITRNRMGIARGPLEECFAMVDQETLDNIETFGATAMNSQDPEWRLQCETMRETNPSINQDICKPWSKEDIERGFEDIKRQSDEAKDECYRKHK